MSWIHDTFLWIYGLLNKYFMFVLLRVRHFKWFIVSP